MASANANAAGAFWEHFHDQSDQIRKAAASQRDARSQLRALDSALREAFVYLPPYDQKKLAAELDELRLLLHKGGAASARGSGFKFRSAGATKPGLPITPTAALPDAQSAPVLPACSRGAGEASLSFSRITRQWLVAGAGDPALPRDCELRDVEDCVVDLRLASDSLRALNCHNVQRTIVLCGMLPGSVTVRNSTRCLVVLGSHQLRFECCRNVDACVSCSSHPVIEQSSDMRFAPYPPQLDAVLRDRQPNLYDKVHDFNWLRRQSSPNWSLAAPQEQEQLQRLWSLVDDTARPLSRALEHLPTVQHSAVADGR